LITFSSKKKALIKNKLVEPIVSSLLPLISEDDGEDEGEDEDNVSRMAAQTLDIMSINLPPEQVPSLNF